MPYGSSPKASNRRSGSPCQRWKLLAIIAYKQPVTAPEVNEIRGVDASGVFGSLLARKLIATAGRKQVIGRPILYKNHTRVSAPLRPARCLRAALHGRVREAGRQ
jgi:hypothetical protein